MSLLLEVIWVSEGIISGIPATIHYGMGRVENT
jgi:hypothetical protein